MEYLGLYNKPKAAVHPECKLMGPKKEEEERKKQKFPLVNHFLYNFFFWPFADRAASQYIFLSN